MNDDIEDEDRNDDVSQTSATAPQVPIHAVGITQLKLKPIATLPTTPFVPGWSISATWLNFYFDRFCDPKEIYVRSEDPKKCGCQKLSCQDNMRTSKFACGFCGHKMSSMCIQDGSYGSCRNCFISHYRQSSVLPERSNEEDDANLVVLLPVSPRKRPKDTQANKHTSKKPNRKK